MATSDSITGPINIGNPEEFSIRELAPIVIEIRGLRSRIVHPARPDDDPQQRRPNISKANDLLSWSPRIPLRKGLSHTIAYFEQMLTQEDVRAPLESAILSR